MSTLSQEILRLETAKANIDNALISRGIVIPQNAKLDTYDTLINSIKGGTSSEEVTATRANVLAGTTTITADSNDEIVEGTMIDNGAVTPSALAAGESYTIPEGYHNGSGIILAKDLASQTQGTATAARIVSGDKAWVNGIQVTGSLAVTSAINFSAATLSATSIRISWTNPTKGAWEGVFIQMSTSGYPGTSGGTRVYTGRGNSTTAGGSNYVDITGLKPGTTHYFTCTSYCNALGWGSSYNVSAKTTGFVLYWDGNNAVNFTGRGGTPTFASTYIDFPLNGAYGLSTSTSIPFGSYNYVVFDVTPLSYYDNSYHDSFKIYGYACNTGNYEQWQHALYTRGTHTLWKNAGWTKNSTYTYFDFYSGRAGSSDTRQISVRVHRIYLY